MVGLDGGDEAIRTLDLLGASEALCQLSYVPILGTKVVGLSGLEPLTSSLSGMRSNQLS